MGKSNGWICKCRACKKDHYTDCGSGYQTSYKAVGSKWSSRTKVSITLNTTKAGTCYYKWVVRGKTAKNDKKNKVDVSKAGNFSIPLDKLDSKNKIDLLVWFEDKDKQEVSKRIKLLESKRPKETTTTKASLRWTGLSWRDHSSATVTCIIGADGVCNYTWKVKGSDKDGGSGSINIKADKSFNIELNNLPDKEIEVYLTAKDSKGKDIDLQPTINGVVKTAKSFKITLSQSSRPATPTPSPTNVPGANIPPVTDSIVQGLVFNGWSLLVMFLNGAVFSAIGVVVSFLAKNHADVPRFSNYIIMPMAFLCNTFFSTEKIPGFLGNFVAALPLSQTSHLIRTIASGGAVNYISILILAAYLVAFSIAASWFIYKKKNL